MSTLAAKAYHPINGSTEQIWQGFSWPCLFLGFLWYLYKGLWGWGLIALILALCTFGLSWFVFPFFANEQHAKSLMAKGYLTEQQWSQKQGRSEGTRTTAGGTNQKASARVADELTKLAQLKVQGILTEDEFNAQKAKLLS